MWEKISEEKRKLFKAAVNSEKYITFYNHELTVKLSALDDSRYHFEAAKSLLDLPCLSKLSCERWYDDLDEYLEANPFLMELQLVNHSQEILDFRKSNLQRLALQFKGVKTLYLNDDLQELTIIGEPNLQCNIFANRQGASLQVNCYRDIPLYPGLENLRSLHVGGIEHVDMKALSESYPDLKVLRLWGKPGEINNFVELENLKKLQQFSTMDLFGFGEDDIPNPEKMKELTWFWMTSLPEEAAKKIKLLYKKSKAAGLDLSISKPRKKEWLAQNLDNPFRGWEGEAHISALNVKKAANLYRKTRASVLKFVESEGQQSGFSICEAIKDYAEGFNKMDKRNSFIETEERENIYDALCAIVDLVPEQVISSEKLIAAFEETRDF